MGQAKGVIGEHLLLDPYLATHHRGNIRMQTRNLEVVQMDEAGRMGSMHRPYVYNKPF
jgi:hypothetical protein